MAGKRNHVTRRSFIKYAGVSALSLPFINSTSSSGGPIILKNDLKRKVYLFSKHLHWLSYQEMSEVVVELGFDGVDLTVRKDGHVSPEEVATQLPQATEDLKKAGKPVKSISTGILKAEDPSTELILKTASQLGITHYRMGWYSYSEKESVNENLTSFEKNLRDLSKLNEKYKIKGAYQNHAGSGFGASIWDLGSLLQKINSPYLGCQFDVRHATVEGANSWKTDLRYIQPFIHSIDIKDFEWVKENGKTIEKNVPLGEGRVDFDLFSKLIRNVPIEVPLILHLEYSLGGAEEGHKQISIPPAEIKKAMKRDLEFIQAKLNS
jgi:L-ribulose-5-phosphate 3-epimerase